MKELPQSLRVFSRTVGYSLIDYDDLDDGERLMFDAAISARRNAQAKYSRYNVGAAVLSENGSIYSGCNVEGVDFESIHAEANAIGSLVRWEGSAKIVKIAFIGAPAGLDFKIFNSKVPEGFYKFVNIPVPCGGCLQRIWENCHGDVTVPIYSFSRSLNCVTRITIDNALPLRFGSADLGIDYSKTAKK